MLDFQGERLPTTSKREPEVVDKLGPYCIEGEIGAGGMGRVLRARNESGRLVALKVLHSQGHSPSRLRRFEHEARATSLLGHANVVEILDFKLDGDVPYIAMELLEGQTLKERLEEGPLSIPVALSHAITIARAIEVAHRAGIVHRDLKPANIFLCRDGTLKLLDFGIAKLESPALPDETLPSNTADGAILGTNGYMSPEQVQGRTVDARSDLFSLGVVLFEMLTQSRPFQRESPVETAYATLRDPVPDLTARCPAASEDLQRTLLRCLAKDPDDRFQSAADLAFHLEELPPPLQGSTPSSSSWLLKWGAAALVVGAVIASIALVARNGEAPPVRPAGSSVAGSPPRYQRLTFRRGSVERARFSLSGDDTYYSAAWGKDPLRLYRTSSHTSGNQLLGRDGYFLLDVSRTGELALRRDRPGSAGFAHKGTLAVAPMKEGGPRDIQEDVLDADFAPLSDRLAIVRATSKLQNRIEFPINNVVHSSDGWISHLRVAPDEQSIAFIDHPSPLDDRGTVAIVDLAGNKTTLTSVLGSVQGLAWSPDGREIWFTGAESGLERSLWAVGLDGHQRRVTSVPGVLTLQDIDATGRLLVTRDDPRMVAFAKLEHMTSPEEMSWFDWSLMVDLAPDGKSIYFLEAGEAVKNNYALYSRSSADSDAVRLASDVHLPIQASRGGQWLLAMAALHSNEIRIIPTGAGSERRMVVDGARAVHAMTWLSDNDVLVQGTMKGSSAVGSWRLNLQDQSSEAAQWAEGWHLLQIDARRDGTLLLTRRDGEELGLFNAAGEMLRTFNLSMTRYAPVGWRSDDELVVLDRSDSDQPLVQLYRLSTATIEPFENDLGKWFAPQAMNHLKWAGSSFALSAMKTTSELYIASGFDLHPERVNIEGSPSRRM